MRRVSASLGAIGLILCASLAWAQGARPAVSPPVAPAAAPAASGTLVALIDLGYLLRNHPGYTAKREALKEKAKAMTNQEAAIRKQLQTEGDKLKDFQQGSLEAKQLEARLTQQASDFQVQAKLQRRELAEEEAKMLYETYVEVQRVIERLSQMYGIGLVIRFDREKMDPADPDSISRGLMNPVVFHQQLDITDLILRELTPNTVRGGGLPNTR